MESSEYQAAFFTSVFSEKRRLTGRLGLRVHGDASFFTDEGTLPEAENTVAIRRATVNTFGRAFLFSPLTYGLGFGIADGNFYFNKGYIWFHEVPYVRGVRAGIFKAPISLESQQSSSVIPMMEVSAPVSAFAPGDLFGIQIGGGYFDQRGSIHTGWFADVVDNEYRDESQSFSRLILRGTWLLKDTVDEGNRGGGDYPSGIQRQLYVCCRGWCAVSNPS